MYQSTYQLYYWLSLSCVSVENRSRCGWQSAPMSCGSMVHCYFAGRSVTLGQHFGSVTLVQTLNVSAIIGFSLLGMKDMASDISAVAEPWNSGKSAKSRKIHKNTQNSAKFGKNLIKYIIWNLSQLLGLFMCRKLANLSWNFVSEMCKQGPKTTRCRWCCKKLGTSYDVKSFATGSFLERVVAERANDDLCYNNVKNAGLISAKPIDF